MFRITALNKFECYCEGNDDVYDFLSGIIGNEELAIEASSWAELATIGEVYTEKDFCVYVEE